MEKGISLGATEMALIQDGLLQSVQVARSKGVLLTT